MIHFLQFKQIYYAITLYKKKETPLFCADVRLVAAKKLMVTKYNTKGRVKMKAFLILEDGNVFTGTSIGSTREVISEIVFNTSMTGYLEVLTDPPMQDRLL